MRPEAEENPVTADPAVPAVGQLDVDGPGRGETGLAHDQLGPAGPVAVQVHPAQALHHRPLPVLDPFHAGPRGSRLDSEFSDPVSLTMPSRAPENTGHLASRPVFKDAGGAGEPRGTLRTGGLAVTHRPRTREDRCAQSRRDVRCRRARAESAANEAASAWSRVANEILTPGGAAIRNRCPGATAQPAEARYDATPSSSGTGTQQVRPDRPLAAMPWSRSAERSASPRAA